MKKTLVRSKYFEVNSIGMQNKHLTFEFLENKNRLDILKIDRNLTEREFKKITDYAINATLDEMISDLIMLKAKLNRE